MRRQSSNPNASEVKTMKITDMKVNGVTNPLGYNFHPLSLSWVTADAQKGEEQKSARVTISEKDTGKIICDSGFSDPLPGTGFQADCTLKPRTAYSWKVQVRGSLGSEAEGSALFETGKMDEAWSAGWITSGDADTPAVLRKTFHVNKAGKPARLYILGLGLYEAYINGHKVGTEYLAPGYHSYDRHLQYQTYDIGELLRDGENELNVYLADGWYRGRFGFGGGYSDLYGNCNKLLAEIYLDGKLVAQTDESWKWRPSPAVFSNIYDGEIFDARVCEDDWKPVELLGRAPAAPVTDRYSLPIVEKERFGVAKILHTPKGESVLDFGQEVTGWIAFQMPAEKDGGLKKREAIRFTASEILQDGNFFRDNYRTARAEFTYISNGEAASIRPHHTSFCFRYLKAEIISDPEIVQQTIPAKNPPEGVPAENRILTVEGTARPLTDEEIEVLRPTAVHLRSDFDPCAGVETGNADVNRLVSNVTWGQKDNFLDVPTDCPQRDERLGWTGDAQIFSETACLNMDVQAFYRKYLWDMRAEQEITDGAVPNVVPRLKAGMVASCGITPWADAGVVIPWNVYQIYGNVPLLREAYPGMKAWVDYERKTEESKGGPHLNKDDFSFGDWLALDNPKPGPLGATDTGYIASAYYYRDVLQTAQAARVLGYDADAKDLKELAREIHKAVLDKYFDESGVCRVRTQTAAAMAIMFELSPTKEAAKKQGDILADLVLGNNNHLNTGFVGTPLLCPALSRTGHHDLAVSLLLNEDCPGWLYSVKMGATTIWERWNSVQPDGNLNPEGMNSLNHYSYGSILGWIYEYLAGITIKEPGFAAAVIEPRPDRRLGKLLCAMDTACGRYVSDWKYDADGDVHYHVEVPSFGRAEVRIDGEVFDLGAGVYDF